jgi:DNA repair exonuclease SbcCD ATPase subunit
MIKELGKSNDKYSKENETLEKEIENLEKTLNTLASSKTTIDENLLKVDITSLTKKMNDVIAAGKSKSEEIDSIDKELKEIGEVVFSVEEYDNINKDIASSNIEKGRLSAEYKQLKHEIEHLKKSEFCPTCGRKLDNVDNSKQIEEKEKTLSKIAEDGKKLAEHITECEKKLESLKSDREKYDKKNKISTKRVALQLNVEQLRNSWKECNSILTEYKKNSEAIDKNNNIDIQIRNNETMLKGKRSGREVNIKAIVENESLMNKYSDGISEREKLIKNINEEEELVKNWKIYMELVGKNGISKMVLRRSLPIINAKLREILSDVCDFDVEVSVNEKNEVNFYIIKDNIAADICSGSGFEKTAASLALRFVLGSVSTIPRLNYVTLDEVWGRVEESNYEPIHSLLDKMLKEYDFLLLVSHQDQIKNWCEKSLVAEKNNNVSTIRVAANRDN